MGHQGKKSMLIVFDIVLNDDTFEIFKVFTFFDFSDNLWFIK